MKKVKSQSEKIRGILYRIWQNTNRKMTEEEYYQMRTGKIIDLLLRELEPPIPVKQPIDVIIISKTLEIK